MKHQIELDGIVDNPKKPPYFTIVMAVLIVVSIIYLVHDNYKKATKPKVVVEENITYISNLPKNILEQAEKHKATYVLAKFEDGVVIEDLPEETQRVALQREYEKAINLLYEGEVVTIEDLSHLLDLVSYTPKLFDDKKLSELLNEQSKALSHFVINYKVQEVLTKPEHKADIDEPLRKVVIAEQGNKIDRLRYSLNVSSAKKEELEEQITTLKAEKAEVEKKLQEALSRKPVVVKEVPAQCDTEKKDKEGKK